MKTKFISTLLILLCGLQIYVATDYDQYDYDWLTAKPIAEATTPVSTRAPDDDDV